MSILLTTLYDINLQWWSFLCHCDQNVCFEHEHFFLSNSKPEIQHCVFDFLMQAWTNGRFKSVKHRAVVNATASRLSIAYFSNPPSSSIMTIPQKLINSQHPLQFRPAFTWGDYKSHLMEMHQKPNGIKASKAWLRSSSSSIKSRWNPPTKTSPHFLMLNSDNNNNNNCMYQSDVSFNSGIRYEL